MKRYSENRDNSNRLTVSINDMPSFAYRFVRWKIKRKFHLQKDGEYTKGLNEKFQKFLNANGSVSIDWDIWSGFTVTALNSESESLVEEIGVYLREKYIG